MAALAPTSGILLNTTQYSFITETINAVEFASVSSWDWTLTPIDAPSGAEGRNINITPMGLSLEVSYYSEETLFPIQWIDYIDKDMNRFRVDNFGDLPVATESPDIVSFRNDPRNLITFQLTVEATGVDSMSLPVSANGTYQIYIFADYDKNNQMFIQQVTERKF
jgi:hypothetical protein